MGGKSETDLIVVGAGAAGLAAARTALSLGLGVTVLEAKDRGGGRARTDTETFGGVPWDRGAQWLHDAKRNPFTRFADAEGLAYDHTPARVRLWSNGGWADPGLHAEVLDYYARAFAAIEQAGAAGLDVAASEVVPPHPRFRAMFDSWFAALGGTEPDRTSTLDHFRYEEGNANYRVEAGYGALVARYGAGLPVELDTPVERIRWGGRRGTGVAVETPRGTLRARAAIVTVSTSVLASGRIAFDPPLPAAKRDAALAVPVGEANKVALGFDRDVFDAPAPYFLPFEHGTLEAMRFEIRPFGRNLAIGYLGGRFAAELEAAGPEAMIAFAEERLVEVYGAGIRGHLTGAATTAWCGDPHIGGGYTCALPGKAHLRPVLAEPLGERVLFAGEACSLPAYGTVHGARQTGEAAARAAAAMLLGVAEEARCGSA